MNSWKLTCSLFVEVKNMGLCSRSLLTFTVFTTFSFIPDLTNIHFQFTKSGISYNKQPILIINLSQGHKVEKLSDIVTYILIYFAFSGSKTGTKWILTEKKLLYGYVLWCIFVYYFLCQICLFEGCLYWIFLPMHSSFWKIQMVTSMHFDFRNSPMILNLMYHMYA